MQSEMEYLQFLHGYYGDSIRSADQKVMVLMTISLAVLAIAGDAIIGVELEAFLRGRSLQMVPPLFDGEADMATRLAALRVILFFVVVSCVGFIIWTAFSALRPREVSSSDDIIYWGRVKKLGVEGVTALFETTQNTPVVKDGLRANVLSLAQILSAKYSAIGRLTSLTIFLFVLIFLYALT